MKFGESGFAIIDKTLFYRIQETMPIAFISGLDHEQRPLQSQIYAFRKQKNKILIDVPQQYKGMKMIRVGEQTQSLYGYVNQKVIIYVGLDQEAKPPATFEYTGD